MHELSTRDMWGLCILHLARELLSMRELAFSDVLESQAVKLMDQSLWAVKAPCCEPVQASTQWMGYRGKERTQCGFHRHPFLIPLPHIALIYDEVHQLRDELGHHGLKSMSGPCPVHDAYRNYLNDIDRQQIYTSK